MKQDAALSSVVGVMLMLTITVVLFGVVALVATSTAGDTKTPVTAELTAVTVTDDGVIFELISGEPVRLSDIRVVLGVREDSTKTLSLCGEPHLKGTETIGLGDRFTLEGVPDTGGMKFDSLIVQNGEHLTYRFYDSTDRPFSSGEIRI